MTRPRRPPRGGVAYLGDTRYGFWDKTALITQAFYKNLFGGTTAPGDDDYFLGPAETWARALYFRDNPNTFALHHCVYTHMLAGDPELNVWTADPHRMDLDIEVG